MDVWLVPTTSFLIFIGMVFTALLLIKRARGPLHWSGRPAGRTARMTETVALGGIGLTLLTLILVYQCYHRVPRLLSSVAPPGAWAEFWITAALLAAAVVACLLLAWFRSTVKAVFVLTVLFCGVGFAVNEGMILSGHRGEKYDEESIPVTIMLADQVVGVDIWANGVYLGKAPIHTTVGELYKLPNSKGEEKPVKPDLDFFKRALPFVFIPFSEAPENGPNGKMIHFRVEYNGERMYGDVASGRRLDIQRRMQFHPGMMTPSLIQLRMILPRWEEEMKTLLQCARLADYQVDAAWVAAADLYGEALWRAVRHASVNEPEFNKTLDAWATQRYKLDGVHGPDSAWDVLEYIADEGEKAERYHSDSPAGRAVDLLVPYLDAERVVDEAERRLEAFRVSGANPWRHVSNGTVDGRAFFSTDPRKDTWDSDYDFCLAPRNAVLVHAVWKLDELLDGKDDSQDNLVEQRITPALLRLKPNDRYKNIDAMAEVLGGSVYDQYVLRHDWRDKDPKNLVDRAMFIGAPPINWWLYSAALLDSEAGRTFRRIHSDEILEMSEQFVSEGEYPGRDMIGPIGYLFLDISGPRPTLASRFWPYFDRHAPDTHSGDPQGAINRWAYLCLLQPDCRPKQFVDVYRRYADCLVMQGKLERSTLATLKPELRLEVLDALLAEAEELLARQKLHSTNYSVCLSNVEQFRWLKFLTPTEQAAEEMVAWLSEESARKEGRIEVRAEYYAERDLFSDVHLKLLAEVENPKLRELVLTSIEKRPTSTRRALLDTLFEDEDESVRTKAKQLRKKLKTLSEKRLPTRG